MNHLAFATLVLLINFMGYSQNIGPVSFNKLPKNLQLFPRAANNMANVPISGVVNSEAYNEISSVMYTKEGLYQYKSVKIIGNRFNFNHEIEAKLVNYNLAIYLKNGNDSSLVTKIDKIVCGDVFMTFGQSNAAAQFGRYEIGDEFCRTYGKNVNTSNAAFPYNEADSLFDTCEDNFSWPGVWMYKLGHDISQSIQVPVLLINGALSGSGMDSNLKREKGTLHIYDRGYYRARKAGVEQHVKAIFYWQGETDSQYGPSALEWGEKFKKLIEYWREDYGPNPWIYVAQIGVLTWDITESFVLKDFQRKIGGTQPRLSSFSVTTATAEYDGIHFNVKGYEEIENKLVPLVLRDVYDKYMVDRNIDTPNPQKVYYANNNKTIVLEYQKNQDITFTNLKTIKNPKAGNDSNIYLKYHFIFDDQFFNEIQNISVDQNKVYLYVSDNQAYGNVSYIRKDYGQNINNAYEGPFIENVKGVKSFSFFRVPIQAALKPVTSANALLISPQKVNINWQPVDKAQNYEISRSINGSKYEILGEIISTNWQDTTVIEGNNYTYKLVAQNSLASSDPVFSPVSIPAAKSPSQLKIVETTASNIKLNWQDNNADNEEEFELSYSSTADFRPENTLTKRTKGSEMVIENLSESKTYFFTVKSYRYRAKKYTEPSNIVSTKTCSKPVDSFEISEKNINKVQLTWTESISDEIGFDILRFDNGIYNKIGETATNQTSFTDLSVADGLKYTYQIVARNSETCRSEAKMADTIVPIASPDRISIKNQTVYGGTLLWADNSKSEKAYEIHLAKDGIFEKQPDLQANSSSFTFTNLLPNTDYKVKVLAKNDIAGKSDFTEIITFKTLNILPNESEQFAKSVYPNPSSGQVFIKAKVGALLTIYNTEGKLITLTVAKTPTTQIFLKPGVYVLFNSQNGQLNKFVVR